MQSPTVVFEKKLSTHIMFGGQKLGERVNRL